MPNSVWVPVWIKLESLESYSGCIDDELLKATGFTSVVIDALDAELRKVMYERWRC